MTNLQGYVTFALMRDLLAYLIDTVHFLIANFLKDPSIRASLYAGMGVHIILGCTGLLVGSCMDKVFVVKAQEDNGSKVHATAQHLAALGVPLG